MAEVEGGRRTEEVGDVCNVGDVACSALSTASVVLCLSCSFNTQRSRTSLHTATTHDAIVSDTITAICCGSVVQQAVRQIESQQQVHNKSPQQVIRFVYWNSYTGCRWIGESSLRSPALLTKLYPPMNLLTYTRAETLSPVS